MAIVNTDEIRRRRLRLKLTLADAAKAAGWRTPVQWHDIEAGKKRDPRASTLVRVAKVLRCKVDQLLFTKD